MINCNSCKSFIPDHLDACPSCSSSSSSSLKRYAKIASQALGAGAISMTLMACYGAPPDNYTREIDSNSDNQEGSEHKSGCPCSEDDHKHEHAHEHK